MNQDLQPLRLLRHRIDRLRDIYYSLLNAPVPVEDWRTWLDRFVALQAQYQAFWRELADEKLAMLLIQPEHANPKSIPFCHYSLACMYSSGCPAQDANGS